MPHTPDWHQPESGVWQHHIGDADAPRYLGIAGTPPKTDALNAMATVDPPFDLSDIQIGQTPRGITLRIPLTPDEQLYGFGLQFKQINQRNKVFHLHVDHYGGQDNGRTHAPVPFYVSSSGYGVLIDAACYLSAYTGTANRADSPNPPQPKDRTTDPTWTAQPSADAVEIFAPTNGATVSIFGGPTPLDAVRRYNPFCGGGCLPPRWALGFWHRVPTPYTSERAEAAFPVCSGAPKPAARLPQKNGSAACKPPASHPSPSSTPGPTAPNPGRSKTSPRTSSAS